MTKLNQIIALEKGVKTKTAQDLAEHTRQLGVATLLSGIARTYQPKDEDGEQLPPESTRVQVKAEDVLERTAATLTRLFDLTATKDWANCEAKADVTVEGRTIIADAPVSYLLFLEKQLDALAALVRKLPVLDPAEEWESDATTNAYRTKPVQTVRSKKVMRNHVVSEATAVHPAQVHVYQEDVPAGVWTTTKFSGALPAARVAQIEARVSALHDAVKVAREHANATPVTDKQVGEGVFAYLLG